MMSGGFLGVNLSPDSHPSLALSCADKLLWFFADEILEEKELAIAYPCLRCRGGLSIFLAYLSVSAERNPPGHPPDPILVYPGTAQIREAYTGLKIRIGDLLDALAERRIRAHEKTGRAGYVYPWEEVIFRRIKNGKLKRSAVYPLHDFFPAAILDESGSPRIFAGRDGFGRGDPALPPLQFATSIVRIPPRFRYRAAVIMHDAVETRAERRRLADGLARIRTASLIHLFESPYSSVFGKIVTAATPSWVLKSDDFVAADSPVPPDSELKRVIEATRRTHSVKSPITDQEYRTLSENFRKLRPTTQESSPLRETFTRLHNCYRLIFSLPVPPETFDEVSDRLGLPFLSERIDEIREAAEALGPGIAYTLVDESVQILRSLLDRVKADPGRARALLSETKRASGDGKRIGIAVSGPIAAAVEQFLSSELKCEPLSLPDRGIHVIEARSLPVLKSFDLLLFLGYRAGGSLRWIMSGRAAEIVIILTEQERRSVARDLKREEKGSASWKPGKNQAREPACAETFDRKESTEKKPKVTESEFAGTFGDGKEVLPDLPLDDPDFFRDMFEYSPSVETGSRTPLPESRARLCLKMIFEKRYAYFPADGSVTVLQTRGTIERRVEEIIVGDLIVFVNGDQRRSIYELMLTEIKKSPSFSDSGDVIQAWHRRFGAEFARSGMTVSGLHRRLRDSGSSVVRGTVQAWVRGDILSPQQEENLRRLFHALGIPDPEGKHSRRIDQSARHLRKVYREFAKAVNAFLLRAGGDDRPEIDALLEKYNLDIDTVRDAVIIQEVREIIPEKVMISASVIGRLYEF